MSVAYVNDVPPADETALLRESVRETLQSLPGRVGDDGWAEYWPLTRDTTGAQRLWLTTIPPDCVLTMGVVIADESGGALYPGPGCEALAAALVLSRAIGHGTVAIDGAAAAAMLVSATEDIWSHRLALTSWVGWCIGLQ